MHSLRAPVMSVLSLGCARAVASVGPVRRLRRSTGPEPAPAEPLTTTAAVVVATPSAAANGRARILPDLAGIVWIVAAGLVTLTPALIHGPFLGPFDLLSVFGLSMQRGVVVHNVVNSDQIQQMIPWTVLAWKQVHHGQLPLWNPYSGLGTPLAFNLQSATFSLPSALGYLGPMRYAYDVALVAKLVIAGTGTYVATRILGVGVLGATAAGTIYELSGPFMGWLGWPQAGVMAWMGWVFAAVILLWRGTHRARNSVLLAASLALAAFGGHPESIVLLGSAVMVLVAVLLLARVRALLDRGPILRPTLDVAVASIAGLALAAPLLLPGLQLTSTSTRSAAGGYRPLPLHDMVHFIFQGFDGLPVTGSSSFGPSNYYESAAYVGAIGVALAMVGLGTRWRRVEVLAVAAVGTVMLALAFVGPLATVLDDVPHAGGVLWNRALIPLAFSLAVLAGVGMDALVRRAADRSVRRWSAIAFGAVGVVLVVLAVHVAATDHNLSAARAHIRAESFVWPAAQVILGLFVVGVLAWAARRRKRDRPGSGGLPWGAVAGLALLIAETAFLITAGTPLWSSATRFLPTNAPEGDFLRAVGTSTVGFSSCASVDGYADLGLLPDVNDAYGVHELSVYDPIIPRAYYRSWAAATGKPAPLSVAGVFCPSITTAALARHYGVAYVLTPAGAAAPSGTVFDKDVGSEALYAVSASGPATLTPTAPDGSVEGPKVASTVVPVDSPDPTTWRLFTDATTPSTLHLRITDVPGWHATLDGHALPLTAWGDAMLQAEIPPGRHTVVVRYWPSTFTIGIGLALCSVIALMVASLVGWRRQ